MLKRRSLTDRLEALEQSVGRLAREQAKANLEWETANQTCRQLAEELSRALRRLEDALQRRYQLEAGLKEEGYRQGRQEVLEEAVQGIITLLDGLHRAILTAQRAGTVGASWLAGLEALHRQGEETLGGWGIQPTSAAGMPYDPQLHEAVAVVEASAPGEPVIAEEVARGYQCDGQVLRMARVVVARYDGDHRHRPGDDQLRGGSDGAGW